MKRRIGIGGFLSWTLVAGFGLGCWSAGETVEHPRGDEAWEMAHSGDAVDEDIVALVDGRSITKEDLLVKWSDHPEWTVEEVLDAVVEREVLAGAAKEEGYHWRAETDFARKQGMVAALLTERVEQVAQIDEAKSEGFHRQLHERRRVPSGLRVTHLVILVPKDLDKEEREIMDDKARRILDEARSQLGERSDDDALRETARRLNEEKLKDGLEAVVNEHIRFPRPGERFGPEQLPSGWTPVVAAFARAAENVAGEEKLGRLSEPVRTEFGWHIIRVHEVMPERPVDPEAAEFYVHDQLLMDAHLSRLGEELRQWGSGARIETYPDRLERSFGSDGF